MKALNLGLNCKLVLRCILSLGLLLTLISCAEEEKNEKLMVSPEQKIQESQEQQKYLGQLKSINEEFKDFFEKQDQQSATDLQIDDLKDYIEQQKQMERKLRDQYLYRYYTYQDASVEQEVREQKEKIDSNFQLIKQNIDDTKKVLVEKEQAEYRRQDFERKKLRDQIFMADNRRDFEIFSPGKISLGQKNVSRMKFCDLKDERKSLLKYIGRIKSFKEKIWDYKYLNKESYSQVMGEMARVLNRFVALEDELVWRGEQRYELSPMVGYFIEDTEQKKQPTDRQKDVLFFYEHSFEYEIPHDELSKEEFLLRHAQLDYLHRKVEALQGNLLLNFLGQVFASDSYSQMKELYQLSLKQRKELESVNRSFHFCW